MLLLSLETLAVVVVVVASSQRLAGDDVVAAYVAVCVEPLLSH